MRLGRGQSPNAVIPRRALRREARGEGQDNRRASVWPSPGYLPAAEFRDDRARLNRSACGPARRPWPAPPACRRRPRGVMGAMPQLVHRSMRSLGTYLMAASTTASTSSGVSTVSLATSMAPTSTSLPFSRPSSDSGTLELRHSTDTWLMLLLGQRREDRLVLAPFAAQRRLPVDVGLDAVAVADVHRRRALEALRGALQRGDAPLGHLAHEHVEGRLVELDGVDAVLLQRRASWFSSSAKAMAILALSP